MSNAELIQRPFGECLWSEGRHERTSLALVARASRALAWIWFWPVCFCPPPPLKEWFISNFGCFSKSGTQQEACFLCGFPSNALQEGVSPFRETPKFGAVLIQYPFAGRTKRERETRGCSKPILSFCCRMSGFVSLGVSHPFGL